MYYKLISYQKQSYKGKSYFFIWLAITNLMLLLSVNYASLCQNVVNNGDNIVITNGANLFISGNYTNFSSNGDGKIDLDGKIIINKNWINNATGNVFTNVEPIPDGYVVLRGALPQFIGGSYSTHFENLSLENSQKTLQETNCEVKGILTLDAVLDLNKKKIILNNNSPTAINYISKYILSESSPLDNYSEVQWNIGSSANTYKVPFGSGTTNNNDLELVLSTRTSGHPSSGSISFATYPADCYNDVLPTDVISLNHDASAVANRYWIINPDYSISKPDIDIVFQYTTKDVDTCNQNIIQENLKAIRYNTSLMTWNDMHSSGQANVNSKTVSVRNVMQNDFYAPWTLIDDESFLYVPNAFTPNDDNKNDFFGPVGIDLVKYTFAMRIFDRWGNMIFKTENINLLWNGKPTGSDKFATNGVYIWKITLSDGYNNERNYNGTVTLLR
ncbi:MAG: gliding motility-associated C-terminal domain-containing protein [Bacteroidetes bacterium]|nr:gliding motility-associated C-terminal domain-containing protein [Bacteroidota bacterium]